MLNFNLSEFSKRAIMTLKKHSPEILTGVGIAGMLTTTVLAVKATPEALRRIEKKKRDENHKALTVIQTVQATWKCYIPATVTGLTSTACLIGASTANGRRNTALATAYSLSETALHEYRDKVVETLGGKKEEAIRESVDKDRVARNPPSQEILMAEGCGKTLCYDATFGRYFYSDVETLRHVANELNRQMNVMSEPYVSLNQFYMEINLPSVDAGDQLGWNLYKGSIELEFSSQLARGSTPCLVMSFKAMPDYRYTDV
ncbi:MAG: DUF6353 family protein [Clostridia bacterium]